MKVVFLLIFAALLSGCFEQPEGGGSLHKDSCQLSQCVAPPPACRPVDQWLGRCNVA